MPAPHRQPRAMNRVGLETIARFFLDPAGRISREEYALGIGFLVAATTTLILGAVNGEAESPALLGFAIIVSMPLFLSQLVLVAKRCHDLGLGGVYVLLLFVPMVGLFWLIVLGLVAGNPGTNAYGAPPRFLPGPGGA